MLAFEAGFAAVLTARFRVSYDDSWSEAAWHGLFHSISAFNNAGFALYSDNPIISGPTRKVEKFCNIH